MNNKKTFTILLTIQLVLVAILLVGSISFVTTRTLEVICCFVSTLIIAVYAITSYKKPHGNLLKYSMAVMVLGMIITATYGLSLGSNTVIMGCILICAALISYTAGRLDRINENKVYFVIIEILLLANALYVLFTYGVHGFIYTIFILKYVIMFTTLTVAYFGRYKEHKNAGQITK